MTERFVPGGTRAVASYVERHHLARYEWACELLSSSRASVIDVACGAGYGTSMLAAASGGDVTGIDVSADTVSRASSAYQSEGLHYIVGDAQSLRGFGDRMLDAVVSFETIEHLKRPQAFLAEAARVLKADGRLLISSPNRLLASPMYPLRRKPGNPFHLFEYTELEFWRELEQHFVVETRLGQGFVPRLLAFWPVQFALKATCFALRRFGAYAVIDRIYHDASRVEVQPVDAHPHTAPSLLVALCRPRHAPGTTP